MSHDVPSKDVPDFPGPGGSKVHRSSTVFIRDFKDSLRESFRDGLRTGIRDNLRDGLRTGIRDNLRITKQRNKSTSSNKGDM